MGYSVRYDSKAKAMYVKLADDLHVDHKKELKVSWCHEVDKPVVILDMNEDGELMGIEILSASTLPLS